MLCVVGRATINVSKTIFFKVLDSGGNAKAVVFLVKAPRGTPCRMMTGKNRLVGKKL